MNPEDFPWGENQQVIVDNPTDTDHRWMVHGKEYVLHAGKQAEMPGFIAWMYVYTIAQNQAHQAGMFDRWNDETYRQNEYSKYVKGYEDLVQTAQQEEPELVREFSAETEAEPDPLPGTGTNYKSDIERETERLASKDESTTYKKRGRPART